MTVSKEKECRMSYGTSAIDLIGSGLIHKSCGQQQVIINEYIWTRDHIKADPLY